MATEELRAWHLKAEIERQRHFDTEPEWWGKRYWFAGWDAEIDIREMTGWCWAYAPTRDGSRAAADWLRRNPRPEWDYTPRHPDHQGPRFPWREERLKMFSTEGDSK